MREWAGGHDQEHHCYQTGCGHLLPLSIFTVTITNIGELVDSLCRDGNAQYIFECLYDQQYSYKWPKTTQKTVKGKSMWLRKCHFSHSFLLRPLCSTMISQKRFDQVLTVILAGNLWLSQRRALRPLTVFMASNSQH